MFVQSSTSSFSESIRTIRTGVVLSGLDNPHKVLVVTSSVPGEGKTTVASNLAAAFGQLGKTLLIDADMRRPSIAKNFGININDEAALKRFAKEVKTLALVKVFAFSLTN